MLVYKSKGKTLFIVSKLSLGHYSKHLFLVKSLFVFFSHPPVFLDLVLVTVVFVAHTPLYGLILALLTILKHSAQKHGQLVVDKAKDLFPLFISVGHDIFKKPAAM